MLQLVSALLITTLLSHCEATFYSKEDKICDPASSGLVTYTGFKIHREYIINGLKPPVIHLNSISHCAHGSVDYERTIEVERDADIQFNKPFCTLVPKYLFDDKLGVHFGGDRSTLQIKKRNQHEDENLLDVLEGLRNGSFKFDKGHHPRNHIKRSSEVEVVDVYDYPEIQDIFTLFQEQIDNHTTSTFPKEEEHIERQVVENYSIMGYLNDFAQSLLDRINVQGISDEYMGRKQFLTSRKMELKRKLDFLENQDELVCYNLVKRKKYAQRTMSIFGPHRFVGAIFECVLSAHDKENVLNAYKTTLKTPEIRCDPTRSKAIAPLVSDNIAKQWFQMSSGAHVMQRIPYLYTPGPFDMKFLGRIEGFRKEDWVEKLDPNQDYDFTDSEIGTITSIITEASNLMCDLTLSMERKLKKQPQLTESYLSKLMGNLETRFFSTIGLVDEEELQSNLEEIEKLWDDLDME